MLKNKRYIGTNFYGDEEFPNTIPAIIEKELFDKVQNVIAKYRRSPRTSKGKRRVFINFKNGM